MPTALMPSVMEVLLNLPHPLPEIWLVWAVLLPWQVSYLINKKNIRSQLRSGAELFNFRELLAVGCVGGFILLSFIFAYCTWLTLRLAGAV
ncbi:hypothetical protein IT575_07640 [bacterium]|nr:hypothetical protein [bacterium]